MVKVVERNWIIVACFKSDIGDDFGYRWVYSVPCSEAEAVHHARAYIEQQGAIESFTAEIKSRFTSHAVAQEAES